jgi:hypothetical protein
MQMRKTVVSFIHGAYVLLLALASTSPVRASEQPIPVVSGYGDLTFGMTVEAVRTLWPTLLVEAEMEDGPGLSYWWWLEDSRPHTIADTGFRLQMRFALINGFDEGWLHGISLHHEDPLLDAEDCHTLYRTTLAEMHERYGAFSANTASYAGPGTPAVQSYEISDSTSTNGTYLFVADIIPGENYRKARLDGVTPTGQQVIATVTEESGQNLCRIRVTLSAGVPPAQPGTPLE